MAARQPLAFHGTRAYIDPEGLFKFQYPSHWRLYQLTDGRSGVLISPEEDNPQTWVMVSKETLRTTIVPTDLEILREGLDEGLAGLPGAQIISRSEKVRDSLIFLLRLHAFDLDGVTKVRNLMVVYAGQIQITMAFQGADRQAYEYWQQQGAVCFKTLNLQGAAVAASKSARGEARKKKS